MFEFPCSVPIGKNGVVPGFRKVSLEMSQIWTAEAIILSATHTDYVSNLENKTKYTITQVKSKRRRALAKTDVPGFLVFLAYYPEEKYLPRKEHKEQRANTD